jgi:hypothetical protein
MTEIIILLIGYYIGYNIGQMILSWQLRDLIVKEARKEGIKVDDEYNIIEDADDKPNVFQLFVEKSNDILYLYERDKNNFICQAKTMEELAVLSLKYKNIKYAAVLHDNDVVAFVNGEVKLKV